MFKTSSLGKVVAAAALTLSMFAGTSVMATSPASANHSVTYCGHSTSWHYIGTNEWREKFVKSYWSNTKGRHIHIYQKQYKKLWFWLDAYKEDRYC